MVLPASHRISRVPWYSGAQSVKFKFRLQDYHLLWWDFPVFFSYLNFILYRVLNPSTSTGLGCSPFARRYLENRFFFLFLRVLRCFSSPGLPLLTYGFSKEYLRVTQVGFPIRKSPDQSLFATPRSISVLIPSFIGSWCQGIRPMPLITWPLLLYIVNLVFNVLVKYISTKLQCWLFFIAYINKTVRNTIAP